MERPVIPRDVTVEILEAILEDCRECIFTANNVVFLQADNGAGFSLTIEGTGRVSSLLDVYYRHLKRQQDGEEAK